MKILNKVLVANRGEIAVRIIKTLKKLGIESVAIYSSLDKDSLHCRMADEAFLLSGTELKDTYLNIPKIIEIALKSGADGIHPGYGFLSENADFSKASADAGVNFIGPDPDSIKLMSDKVLARKTMSSLNIPMINGFEGTQSELERKKHEISYPALVKSAAGGGGKAMRIVLAPEHLSEALEISSRESQNYFGSNILFIEEYKTNARHIEVQILADHYENFIILGDRECSIQRRHQKVIEEAPASSLTKKVRSEIFNSVEKIISSISYTNAGTLEFLVDSDGNHYFLEMNTRIQVEHAVTEMVTGVDIVELQIIIASGRELQLKQEDIRISGHAIEARIYAEDPENAFLPSPGKIQHYSEPQAHGLRIDSGIDGKTFLHPEFDPLIAKVIFHAGNRIDAISGLNKSLKNFVLQGAINNLEFLSEILQNQDFISNDISTVFLENNSSLLVESLKKRRNHVSPYLIVGAWLALKLKKNINNLNTTVWSQIGYWRTNMVVSVKFNTKNYVLKIIDSKPEILVFEVENKVFEIKVHPQKSEFLKIEFENKEFITSAFQSESGKEMVWLEGLKFEVLPSDNLPEAAFYSVEQKDLLTGSKVVKSPLHGKIAGISALQGKKILKGELLFTLDAMKIENKITSIYEGTLKEVLVNNGDQVQINQTIMIIE